MAGGSATLWSLQILTSQNGKRRRRRRRDEEEKEG